MLQRLLDLKPEVLCDTVHGALTGILQQLLVAGHAAVDLVGASHRSAHGRRSRRLRQSALGSGSVPLR